MPPSTTSLDTLLWLLERHAVPGGRLPVVDLMRRRTSTSVLQLCEIGILPYWSNIRRYLQSERDARARIAMNRGVELLLSTLHPKIHWNAPVLEVPGGSDEDVHLDGRGLLLAPSLFLTNCSSVLLNGAGEAQPVLAFGTTPRPEQAACLWQRSAGDDQALGALMGQTRAAALQALADSCTTTELADRLGISSAGASQHTSVLRHAGLITTRRNRNAVLHTLTPLGEALLGGTGSPVPALSCG